MFGSLGNLASLMQQAQKFRGRLEAMNDQLRAKQVVGSAAGGLVEVEMNGLQEATACRIDPSLLARQDRELLEDLLRSAMNDAVGKAREAHTEVLREATSGLEIPGLEQALSRLTGAADQTES
jgi:DNA-binding YbaB/EbfC family protein